MLISLLLLALIASGGMGLTYIVIRDKPLLWRLSAGTVAGSSVFGLIGFILASAAGFTPVTILLALAISMLPLLILRRADILKEFKRDWARAKGTTQGANVKKLRRFAYYAFFFLLFWLFFDRTMMVMNDGIFTGGSQNLGDLPFHLGTIFGFTDGNNFPPQNPSWAGAKFTYPFIADFLSACFVKLGAEVSTAMFVQNVAWAFSLVVILENFVLKVTGNKLAGRIAPVLLILSGGFGFFGAGTDLSTSGKGLYDFLMNLPRDYTINDNYRWGNSLVVLFMTQRSLLLGMPLTVLALGYLWKLFSGPQSNAADNLDIGEALRKVVSTPLQSGLLVSLLVGLLAGTLPMIHMHSLVVLFIVTAFLFVMRPGRWMDWIAFGVGVALVAVPEIAWLMSGSATESTKFFDWFFGWDKRESDFFWFWFTNTGLVFPILIAGVWVYLTQASDPVTTGRGEVSKKKAKVLSEKSSEATAKTAKGYFATASVPDNALLLYYIPFLFLFVISNSAKLAPWEWDNIKILIYWFVGSLPLIALTLAWAWEKNKGLRIASGVCIVALVLSGSLDVWRTISGQIKYGVFDADAVKIAELIKEKTDPTAMFLNAPTYNSPVVLTGRQSVMRYSGHLASHGINYFPREAEVKQIYSGGGVADILLKKYNVDYVIFTPEERNTLKANEEFFKKYPILVESGQYRVYKVTNQ